MLRTSVRGDAFTIACLVSLFLSTTANATGFLALPFRNTGIKIQQGWTYTWGAPHKGIDYIQGTLDDSSTWQSFEVIAAAEGMAIATLDPSTPGYGTFVYIWHQQTDSNGFHYFTLYGHLSTYPQKIHFVDYDIFRTLVGAGDFSGPEWVHIDKGETIGISGDTGTTPGWIHLHFEAQRGGYAQNKTDPYDIAEEHATREYYPGGSLYTGCGPNFLWTACPPQIISVSLTPSPGPTPLTVTLAASVSGNAVGTINYTFWWNCNDPSNSVEYVTSICGNPRDPSIGAKVDGISENPKTVTYTYPAPGIYTVKVIVERGSAAPVEQRVSIAVLSQGWNFIAFPFAPQPTRFSELFAELGSNLWDWIWFTGDSRIPRWSRKDQLPAQAKQGYFLYLFNRPSRPIPLTGTAVDPGVTLHRGFNFVGVTQPALPVRSIQTFPYKLSWQADQRRFAWTSLFGENLVPGIGYLVFSWTNNNTLIPDPRFARPVLTEPLALYPVRSRPLGVQTIGAEFEAVLQATQQGTPPIILTFGIKPEASDEWDGLDTVQDFSSPGAMLGFFDEGFGLSRSFKADGDVKEWPLIIISQSTSPGVPDNLNPITLSWTIPTSGSVASNARFQLLDANRNVIIPDMRSTTTLSVSVTMPGMEQRYIIRAYVEGAEPPPLILPGVPASITYPTSSTTGRYTVTWTPSDGAEYYELERLDLVDIRWILLYSGPNLSRDETVGNGLYRYRVRAINGAGASDWRVGDEYINVTQVEQAQLSGIMTTVAGNGTVGLPGQGDGGPATSTGLSHPFGISVDGAGNLYIADRDNAVIRKVDTRRILTTVAGAGSAYFSGDGGPAVGAGISRPGGVFVDRTGNLFIADADNHRIRKVDTTGIITTIAGNGTAGFSGDGGPATAASLYFPTGVAVDGNGNVYIADRENSLIRRVDPNGIMTTVAGNREAGDVGDGGPATAARLSYPWGVCVDGAGNLYIADSSQNRIRKVGSNGIITTVAGYGFRGFAGDGGPPTLALLNEPNGVALDGAGNLYIADSGNHRIRKVDANGGFIITVAGNGTAGFSVDRGSATAASLDTPYGVAVDGAGNLYLADTNNFRIRKVSAPAPVINVHPSALDFGTVVPGTIGGPDSLTVVNNGTTLLTASLQLSRSEYALDAPSFGVAPGDSQVVHVRFAPPTAGTILDTMRVQSNDSFLPLVPIPLRGQGQQVRMDTLYVSDVFAKPGGQAIVVLTLATSRAVSSLRFTMRPTRQGLPTSDAHFNRLINDLEGAGFTATAETDPDGITTVQLSNPTEAQLAPGRYRVLTLVYDVPPQTPPEWIDLAIWNTRLSDSNQAPIPHTLWPGAIRIGRPGDLAGGPLGHEDGQVNIFDIIKEVNYVIGRLPLPEPTSFAFFVADANGDGQLDIVDIIRIVNLILGRGAEKPLTGPTGPVRVELGELLTVEKSREVIPIRAQFEGVLAGLQLTLSYDPTVLTLGDPIPTTSLVGMTVESHATNGTLRLLVYSVDGHVFHAGALNTLLTIPVKVQGGETVTGTLVLSHVVTANAQAERVPTTITTGTVKISAVPTTFALKPNRPNPFNPGTQIAYEVSQTTHVTLVVYNILGQEVVRLVDEVKTPGRYVVTWDGRNGQGLRVASGVYLYRMTTNIGFSQTRRMTLLR